MGSQAFGVGGSKVAAMGIRARRWVTYHGLALNVTTDLSPYSHIIPCGISDKPVTSIAKLLGNGSVDIPSEEFIVSQYASALLQAMEEVFSCKLNRKVVSADFEEVRSRSRF